VLTSYIATLGSQTYYPGCLELLYLPFFRAVLPVVSVEKTIRPQGSTKGEDHLCAHWNAESG